VRVEYNFKSEGFYIFECRQIELRDFLLVECAHDSADLLGLVPNLSVVS